MPAKVIMKQHFKQCVFTQNIQYFNFNKLHCTKILLIYENFNYYQQAINNTQQEYKKSS